MTPPDRQSPHKFHKVLVGIRTSLRQLQLCAIRSLSEFANRFVDSRSFPSSEGRTIEEQVHSSILEFYPKCCLVLRDQLFLNYQSAMGRYRDYIVYVDS